MGAAWSSSTNVYVFLDKGAYKPGDTVTGNICVATRDKAINLSSLHLKVEGCESTRWRSNSSSSQTQTTSTSTNDGYEWQTGSRTFLKFEVPLHSYIKEKEGQYQHPFSFVLPHNIPGSFKYESSANDARAELKYTVTGCLHSGGGAFTWGGKLQHTADLLVIDPMPSYLSQPTSQERRDHVASCWGCCLPCFPFLSQGTVHLRADVATVSAAVGSEVPVAVAVQNFSSAPLELRVTLRHTVSLRGQNTGGSARTETITTDVWTARQTSARAHDRAQLRTSFSPQLPPNAVRSVAVELFSSAYELAVEACPGGGCCGRAIVLRFPIRVGDAALEHLDAEKLPAAPPDWHPYVFPDKRLELPPPPEFHYGDLPPEPSGFFTGYNLQPSAPPLPPTGGGTPDHHPLPSAPPPDAHVEGIADAEAESSAMKEPLLGLSGIQDSTAVV